MCGRYVATTPPEVLATVFSAAMAPDRPDGPPPVVGARWNVAPTDSVHAVAVSRSAAERRVGVFAWGLVPSWAKDRSGAARMINARSETAASKPAFRNAVPARRRCIVPADAFYEWRTEGKLRRPHVIRHRDGSLMAFAGLWEVWRDPSQPEGPLLRTCTILTTRANSAVAPLHERMPVVLPETAWSVWLDPEVDQTEEVVALLTPAPAEGFEVFPVSTAVNSVRNDGPELMTPAVTGS